MSTKRHKVPPVPPENHGHAADVARLKGWTVGTTLIGDEGYGPTQIVITAIGYTAVLARKVNDDGELGWESMWTFSHRDWQVVEP